MGKVTEGKGPALRRPFLYGAAFAFMLFGAAAILFKDARLPRTEAIACASISLALALLAIWGARRAGS